MTLKRNWTFKSESLIWDYYVHYQRSTWICNGDGVCLSGPRLCWLLTVKDPRHWARWPAAGGGNGKTQKMCWSLPLGWLWPSTCRDWSSWALAPAHPSSSGLQRRLQFREEKEERSSHGSCVARISREKQRGGKKNLPETLTVRLRCSTEDQVVAGERLRDGANVLSLGTLSIWMEQWVTLDANSARMERRTVAALSGLI